MILNFYFTTNDEVLKLPEILCTEQTKKTFLHQDAEEIFFCVKVGDTACKAPDATAYNNKVITSSKLGKKRKKLGADYTGHFS